MTGTDVDLAAVNGAAGSTIGVTHGEELLAFTEALMRGETATDERKRVQALLSPAAFVDLAAVIGSFNVVDRIADATGIPLDPMMLAVSGDVREQLQLSRFGSSANTPTE